MFVFDMAKLHKYYNDIATGFTVHLGLVILFFVIVLAAVALLVISLAIIRRRERRQMEETLRKKNERIFSRFNLDASELELIDGLSAFLTDPAKKYLLLTNQHAFHSCLQKLRQQETVVLPLVVALQKKLGAN